MFNKSSGILIVLSGLFFSSVQAHADDIALEKRITALEARLEKMERLLDEKFADDRWK